MKYAITHCYTDQNKGDAAIIVATTQLIRKLDTDAEIAMFSTYGPNDIKFKTEHEFISEFSEAIHPGMFYQPQPMFFGLDVSRVIHFSWIAFKFLMLLVSKNKYFLSLFFSSVEKKGIHEFLSSDIVISKGGSYITTQNKSLRQSFSLITMLYPFILAKRYNKKMVIFSQSLGPVAGKLNRLLMKYSLSSLSKIYLREAECLKEYQEIAELKSHVDISIIPDTAFYLDSVENFEKYDIKIDKNNINVGITVVDHAFKYIESNDEKVQKIDNYKQAILDLIDHLVKTYGAKIHIFPQVIVANSHLGHNDVRISKEIESICEAKGLAGSVKYHFKDYNPMQLRAMYREMDFFIGTRLHSVIFSLSQCVPSINISYHGTKSRGILGSISGFEDNVISIDDITSEILIEKVETLMELKDELVTTLALENNRLSLELEQAMAEVIRASNPV